jgi:hypothetical protein
VETVALQILNALVLFHGSTELLIGADAVAHSASHKHEGELLCVVFAEEVELPGNSLRVSSRRHARGVESPTSLIVIGIVVNPRSL